MTDRQKRHVQDIFLSTPSARRATQHSGPWLTLHTAFLSTPSARRATPLCAGRETPKKFLSTPSARRATARSWAGLSTACTFLSTPSARRATATAPGRPSGKTYFYPRPLRGGRHPEDGDLVHVDEISIHALCEEGDVRLVRRYPSMRLFLSTPSARRATAAFHKVFPVKVISIHALCEEGDPCQ